MSLLTRAEAALKLHFDAAAGAGAPQRLQAAMQHAVFSGGARIRPQLCMAVALACGDDVPELTDAAATAIELMHCASLVHDDMPCFDDADMRRGQVTVHKQFGEPLALLTGDALIVAAYQTLVRAGAAHPQRLVGLLELLGEGVGAPSGIVAGQAWECETRADLGQYQRAKTGALFVAATCAGAESAGADPLPWRALGDCLGEAYQVADDIRDVLADQAMMGKPQGQDITHDRPSSARDLGLVGAVQHFDELVYKAINSIPSCKGEKMLRGLVAKEAERLIPESWFANTNRPLHHHATV